MTAKPRNQAAALLVPYPAGTATELPLRIVPETTGNKTEIGAPSGRNTKSRQVKALDKKKSARKKKNVQKQKLLAKRAPKVKSAPRNRTNKMAPPPADNARPQLVPDDKTPAVVNPAELLLTTNADFFAPVTPVAVIPEEARVAPDAIVFTEIIPDQNAEALCIPTECSAIAAQDSTPHSTPTSTTEKQTFLQALAFQLMSLFRILTRTWIWTQQKLKSAQVRKRLRVCESVSLGDKRFIAVIQVDGEQFLVGGSSSSVSTLAHLEPRPEFSDVFRRCEQGVSQT